jgi:hypothetical protein
MPCSGSSKIEKKSLTHNNKSFWKSRTIFLKRSGDNFQAYP